MNLLRNEVRTGLLVLFSLGAVVLAIIYLGAPGVFSPQNVFRIYFDNAGGIKPGAQVLLAGRKIGQVKKLFSPVPDRDRPNPRMETLIEVQVNRDAQVYNSVKVQMTQSSLLGEAVIDFTNGQESSGLAKDGTSFIGERPSGLADAVPAVLEKLDPALAKVTTTLESLQRTADNLTRLTAPGADLPIALAEFRKTGTNLHELTSPDGAVQGVLKNLQVITGPDGSLGKSLDGLAAITGAEGPLVRTFQNTEKFTASLTNNRDLEVTLKNFRSASERLSQTVTTAGQQFSAIGLNLEEATDTLKRQPWRLIWPTTKSYQTTLPPPPVRPPEPVRRPPVVKKTSSAR